MKRDPRCKLELRDELKTIELYKKGFSLNKIAKKFNVSTHCIQNIFKVHNFKTRSHGEGTRLLYKHIKIKPPKDFPWYLKNKFDRLIAIFLLTDGYLNKNGKIMLICTDKILQNYFLSLFKEKYNLSSTTNSYMYRGKATSIYSKDVASDLLKLSPTYNTYPGDGNTKEYLKNPQPSLSFLGNEKKNLLIEAIRIAMSAEGSVKIDFPRDTVYPKLEFACSHLQLTLEWQKIFKKIGIKTFLIKSKVTWSKIQGLGISELKSIKRFIDVGGFIKGVGITGKSKYYKKLTKNDLLKTIFILRKNSFYFPSNINDNEHKHKIIRDIITNPKKRKYWWKICIEKPKMKRQIEKQIIKNRIVEYVKKRFYTHKLASWNELEDKFNISLTNYFRNGLEEIYRKAGIILLDRKTSRQSILATRNNLNKLRIIEFIGHSAKTNKFPTWKEIDNALNVSYAHYFKSIVDAYEQAGIRYHRSIKRKAKRPFKSKDDGRKAVKSYILESIKKGLYPSRSDIENNVRIRFSSYFPRIKEAYKYTGVHKTHIGDKFAN